MPADTAKGMNMQYTQLTQFLGFGEVRAIGSWSYKQIGALLVGLWLGRMLSGLFFENAVVIGGLSVLAGWIGIRLFSTHQGMVIARRLLMRLSFYIRRAASTPTITAAQFYGQEVSTDGPIDIRTWDDVPLLTDSVEEPS